MLSNKFLDEKLLQKLQLLLSFRRSLMVRLKNIFSVKIDMPYYFVSIEAFVPVFTLSLINIIFISVSIQHFSFHNPYYVLLFPFPFIVSVTINYIGSFSFPFPFKVSYLSFRFRYHTHNISFSFPFPLKVSIYRFRFHLKFPIKVSVSITGPQPFKSP